MQFICCQIVQKEQKEERAEDVEKQPLLETADVKPAAKAAASTTQTVSKEVYSTVSGGLDLFKGVLCFLMVYSHVNLCIVNPTEVYYSRLGHFVGNAASGMCFLGFVFSYGYTCYWAYLSEWTPRPLSVKVSRVLRSAALPILGAWVCSFAWAYMCFKIPITQESFVDIIAFYYVWGNGPDFLISFTTLLLVSFCFRHVLNACLTPPGATTVGRVRFAGGCAALVVAPLLLTQAVVPDCTGNARYFQFFLPCNKRDPVGMANLPALPHFFYFNLGVLAAVGVKYAAEQLESLVQLSKPRQLLSTPILSAAALGVFGLNAIFVVFAYPLYLYWYQNFGNIAIPTPYGEILRGWSRGPSPLWLVANLWAIYTLLIGCMLLTYAGRKFSALGSVLKEVEHFGANVLIYLIVSDIILAGMYRGTSFPLTVMQGGFCTCCILLSTRFVHYLGASGRK
jgi:hypothetical protein